MTKRNERQPDNAAEAARTIRCMLLERYHVIKAWESHVHETSTKADVRRRHKLLKRLTKGMDWLELGAKGVLIGRAREVSNFTISREQAGELLKVLEAHLVGKALDMQRHVLWPIDQLDAFVADEPEPVGDEDDRPAAREALS